jgi:phosphoesterase RecJ-like protein
VNSPVATPPITPAPLPSQGETLDGAYRAAAELLEKSHRIAVAAHIGPDGDAIGSTLGLTNLLREMGKEVTPFNHDPVPYNFSFMKGADTVVTDLRKLPRDLDLFVVLDCASLERVHPQLSIRGESTSVLVIDHHRVDRADFADVFVHDEGAAAVGEMLYRLVVALGRPLSRDVAECLFCSIHTDTGSYRYSNTSPAVLLASSELVRAGVDVWHVCSETYENHPVARVELLAKALSTLHVSGCGRFAFLTVTRDMYRETGGGPEMLDGFINFARGISGVEVAAQLREVGDDKFRVSLRSRGKVDVAALAGRFGGGGHHNAAGCGLDGQPREVIAELEAAFREILDGSAPAAGPDA